MRRATITLNDDLDRRVERFRSAQRAKPSLTAVVQAALEDYLEPGDRQSSPEPLRTLGRVLRHRADIRRVVSEHGGSGSLLFGSMARGEADETSDVDLLVDLEPGRTLFDLAALRAELEELLGVPVDVVTTSGLEGDIRDEILAEAIPL